MFIVPKHPEREGRKQVNFRGLAVQSWGDYAAMTMANLSYSGCEIRTPLPMQRGDTLQLKVSQRGTIKAQVCWTGLQRAGCKFIVDDSRETA
jgi:hypothetical protein